MFRTRILWCALAALMAAAGCSQDDLLRKLASDEDQKSARQCIDLLRDRKFSEIEARMDPSLKNPQIGAVLEQMANMLPEGQPDAVELVGAHVNIQNGARGANLTYQFTWGSRNFLINCAIRAEGDARVYYGMEVLPLDKSVEEQSRFTLEGKSALQYGVLFAAVVFLGLSLLALIRCIMEKNLRRKWLWILFILFGLGKLSVDWNSGAWEFGPLNLLLFSASAVSTGYGPWVVSVALPLGAIWYLTRRCWNHRTAARSKGD